MDVVRPSIANGGIVRRETRWQSFEKVAREWIRVAVRVTFGIAEGSLNSGQRMVSCVDPRFAPVYKHIMWVTCLRGLNSSAG